MVSPDLLKKLATYVPTPIAHAIFRQPRRPDAPIFRRFPAAVLLTDISGFTPLSELLSQAGPTGAEELTQLINQYFTQMIQLIEAYCGQVVNFSGDAIIALFHAEEIPLQLAVRRASECALAMQAKMSTFTNLQTSQGNATLSMTVGIGAGQVLEASIGGVSDQWEYLVGGEPLIQVAQAEQRAHPGQIILSPRAWQKVEEFFSGEAEPENHRFVNLHRTITSLPVPQPDPLDWSQLSDSERQLAAETLQCYIPSTITARLDEQADWLAELRRMTILFVGIGGLDYEATRVVERLQAFIRSTQRLILDYEGLLTKVTVDDKGTVLLILFGAPPFAHEDDASRAVAFALNLHKIAQVQNLHISIGITVGQVFAGPVGAPNRREYTVIGDEVNLAARLMQYGRAGSIVVSGRVKARAGTRFITESLGQISLKGKTAVLSAHLVKGEEGTQDRFITRYLLHEDPLIGRKAELEESRRLAGRARAGALQTLLIEAELGLGKSRLVSEMVREWVMEGGVGYGSKCISYGQQIPYQAWREILTAIYGLTSNLSGRRQLARLAMGVAELEDLPNRAGYWEARLPLLADVLGLDIPENDLTRQISGELRRNNTFELIEALLRRQVARRPLLIVLEDVHWADELSLLLTMHLTKVMADTPLLLVLTYRPLTTERNLSILEQIINLSTVPILQLQPLSAEESLDLIGIILGDRPVPAEAKEILLSRGQGNPFFLREISQAVLDVLQSQSEREFDLLTTLDLPDTVHDAIFMHIDRLPEAEKLTLKVASVIGVRFQRSILSAIHPTSQQPTLLSTHLEGLENENLIRMEIPAPKWEYVFRNMVTQEIVYEGLLLAQRRQLHAAVGSILENEAPDEIESLAFHYSRSDNWQRALHYLKIAGQKAQREYANQVAINYYSKILTGLADLPAECRAGAIMSADYWDVLLERARLYNLTGQRDNEMEDLGTLGLVAEALSDNSRRALSAKQWAYFYESRGDYDSSLEMIERSIELATEAGDERLIGEGYNQSGKLLHLRRDYQAAEEQLQQALRIAQRINDKSVQADCMTNLGIVARHQADYDIALYFFQESAELYRARGDQMNLGNTLRYLGQVYYDIGQPTAARQRYDESLKLHSMIGDRVGEALTQQKLGQLYRSLGNYVEAKILLDQALLMHISAMDQQGEAHSLCHLGFLHFRLADYETAKSYFEKALAILYDELDDPWGLGRALTYYSWALIDKGHFHEARERLQETLRIGENLQQEALLIENGVHLGRVALALNDLSLAYACVRHALSYIDKAGLRGIEHPARLYLTCYRILQANEMFGQAEVILKKGQEYLAMQAAQIDDPAVRNDYLSNIPENKELQELTVHSQESI